MFGNCYRYNILMFFFYITTLNVGADERNIEIFCLKEK